MALAYFFARPWHLLFFQKRKSIKKNKKKTISTQVKAKIHFVNETFHIPENEQFTLLCHIYPPPPLPLHLKAKL